MPAITFSTATLPVRDQFPFWAELASTSVIPIAFDRLPGSGPGFRGEMAVRRLDGVTLVDVRSDNHLARRGSEHVARTAEGLYSLSLPRSGLTRMCSGGRELVTGRSAGLVTAPEALVEGHAVGRFDFLGWIVPPAQLDPLLPRRRPPAWQVQLDGGVGSLLLSYAGALAAEVERIEAEGLAESVTANFCRLLAIAAGAALDHLEGGREAVRAAGLERAKRYVERHLADPGLSSALAARALGISVRQLHLLFEPAGTSFARHVLRRRLEEAHAALAGPGSTGRTVAEVAFAWGFDSLPTFYRAFRRAYGAAPGDVRAAAKVGRG